MAEEVYVHFKVFWYDLTGVRTHDLRIWGEHTKHFTTDAVYATYACERSFQ
jgi:uncharacterized protein YcfL